MNSQVVQLGEPVEHPFRQRLEVVLTHIPAELSGNDRDMPSMGERITCVTRFLTPSMGERITCVTRFLTRHASPKIKDL